jgi:hypothetical protein
MFMGKEMKTTFELHKPMMWILLFVAAVCALYSTLLAAFVCLDMFILVDW